jgi:hypothetical protein
MEKYLVHAYLIFFPICRRLEIWPLCLPILAVSGLHGLNGLHFQPVNLVTGSVLVDYVTIEISATSYKKKGPRYDNDGLDRGIHVVYTSPRMELHS